MPDSKLSALVTSLPALTWQSTDHLYIEQGGVSKGGTLAQLRTFIGLANTFTAAQAIASGTLTVSAPALTVTQTWNALATVFTADKINITDTTSDPESLFSDYQVASLTQFSVRKDGKVYSNYGFYGNSFYLIPSLWAALADTLIFWGGRAVMASPADGVVKLSNNAQTDFSRLQLGGTTSSFPSLKRSAATVAFRLADDSADAAIATAGIAASGSLTFGAAATGPILKQGANGRVGTFVLNGSTPVTVSNTSIAITDAIIFSLNTVGGVVGVHPTIVTITAGTGFTVAGTAADTSTYNYAIIKNAA